MYGSRRLAFVTTSSFLKLALGRRLSVLQLSGFGCLAGEPAGSALRNPSQIPAAWTCAEKLLTLGLGASGIDDAATGVRHGSEQCGGLATRGVGAASPAPAPHCLRSFGHPRWSADGDCGSLLGPAVFPNTARA